MSGSVAIGGMLAVLFLSGCMTADEKAQRAVTLDAELSLTNLVIDRLRERRDSMELVRRPDSLKLKALNDSIIAWRVSVEKIEGELRKLRR